MSQPELTFARAQARVGLGGVLASLPVRWVNHPASVADHEYKPGQLRLAELVGLKVPPTLVTNAPDAVRAFADEIGEIIVKPLTHPVVAEAGGLTVAWTRRLRTADLNDLDSVRLTAHLFQEWLPKEYELRLTVVGDKIFCVAIYAHSDAARTDWRSDYDALSYDVIDCPRCLVQPVREYMKRAHLAYGAFDFIVTEDDAVPYFLECNSGGQWGWLATECQLPIAEALADHLIGAVDG